MFVSHKDNFGLTRFLERDYIPLYCFVVFCIGCLYLIPHCVFASRVHGCVLDGTILVLYLDILLRMFLRDVDTPPPPRFTHRVPPH